MKIIERYYAVLQKIYKIIADNLQKCRFNKNIILQMIVKTINNIVSFNSLMLIFLIFGVYFCMSKIDFLILIITQYIIIIKNTIKKVQKIRAEKQVTNVLNQKNTFRLIVSIVYDLLLNWDIFIWQKSNIEYSGR